MYEFEDEVFESVKKKKLRIASKFKKAKFEIPLITPAKLKSKSYNIISKYSSIYKDNSWKEIQKMVGELDKILPNLSIIESKYFHDTQGVPNGKKWRYVGAIEDNKKKKWAVIIDVTAAGAGLVDEPLSKYDVTAVVNVLSPRNIRDIDVLDYLEQYKIQ